MGGLILIALALRLPSLNDSLWGDEVGSNYILNGFGVGGVLHLVEGPMEGTPPLFHLLTSLTKGIGGVEGLRLVSLVAGLASIPLVYLLGMWTVGRLAAWVATALFVLSPFQIFYATEARAYALVTFLTLVASVSLMLSTRPGATRWWWVAYALSSASAVYTHYTAVFLLAGLFLWGFIAHPEARKPLLISNVAAALLFVPWLGQLSADTDAPQSAILDIIAPLTVHTVVHQVGNWAVGAPAASIKAVPGLAGFGLIVAGVAIGAAGLLVRLVRAGKSWRPDSGLALVMVLALAMPVGAVIWGLFFDSIYTSRNLITSRPAYLLLLAALVTSQRPWLRWLATGLLIAGFAIGGLKMLDEDHQRPEYLAAARYIEDSGGPADPVAELSSDSPGPQSPGEAALAPKGKPVPPDRPVIVLGLPTMQRRLEDLRTNGAVLYPTPPPAFFQEQAHRAARLAKGDRLYLLTQSDQTLEQLRATPGGGPWPSFLSGLPPGFREVASKRFPGIVPISVYVLERPRATVGHRD